MSFVEQTQAVLPETLTGAVARVGECRGELGVLGRNGDVPVGTSSAITTNRGGFRSRPVLGSFDLRSLACYHCPTCRLTSYPLDEQLGLGESGRMSRYLQEQCGWLLALLPARLAEPPLSRFGWPAVPASQIREHGEAPSSRTRAGVPNPAGACRQTTDSAGTSDAAAASARGRAALCGPRWGHVVYDRA